MPFQSKSQQRYLFAKEPEVAKRWEDKYGIPKGLPQHAAKTTKTKKRARKVKPHG